MGSSTGGYIKLYLPFENLPTEYNSSDDGFNAGEVSKPGTK